MNPTCDHLSRYLGVQPQWRSCISVLYAELIIFNTSYILICINRWLRQVASHPIHPLDQPLRGPISHQRDVQLTVTAIQVIATQLMPDVDTIVTVMVLQGLQKALQKNRPVHISQ